MKKKKREHGMITVFVTLLMVPVVAITGIMVDVSRLKLYSSQAAMAADSYGAAVLSDFDNLLKQLYGLFSVTQNEEGLEALSEFEEYMGYSFHPDGDGKGLSGFMPYKNADVELSYENADGASLSNNNVLMTQISDFMRYRIVEEVLEGAGALDALSQFDHMASDMDAMKKRSDITDSSAEALGKIDNYYETLKQIDSYTNYLDDRGDSFYNFSQKMTDIAASEEYEDYVYYMEHQEEIEEMIAAFEAEDDGTEDDEGSEGSDLAYAVEIYEKYADYDAAEYRKKLRDILEPYEDKANNHDSEPADFYNIDGLIDTLGKRSKELKEVLSTIKEQVNRLKEELVSCSEEVKKGMEEEIQDLEKILELSAEFEETYQLIAVEHDCKRLNEQNEELMRTEVPTLDRVKKDLVDGEIEPRTSDWPGRVPLLWYDFRDDKGQFYSELYRMCEGGQENEGDKKAGEKEKKRAQEAEDKAKKEIEGDEKTNARDISPALAGQLHSGGGGGFVPGVTEYFSSGMSFEALSGAGGHILDKFLVTTYDFGMFSSRVTGIDPETNLDRETERNSESYADYSLTNIKMSKDVNYLYGAELEYLLGGYNRSVDNLNNTRNIVCGVRLTMNFSSTYIIKEVNTAIRAIADAAAAAVAATGIGAAAAPLVKVGVSGALRMAVASIEMAADWKDLKDRQDVVFLKTELADLKSVDTLAALLKIDISKSGRKKAGFSYEDYLYVLLCLLVDDNTLLSRTSNLITLNVNQSQNDQEELTELEFKMEDTVTAVKATCKVKADFVIVPENMAQMFFGGTEADAIIQKLEDNYFGYSVIRGY